MVVLRRLLDLSNGPLTVAGAHAPRRSFPSPKGLQAFFRADGRVELRVPQRLGVRLMKIWAAHAVWGLILARRAWWPDQRDRVVPRYAAQAARRPLFFRLARSQNPRRPRFCPGRFSYRSTRSLSGLWERYGALLVGRVLDPHHRAAPRQYQKRTPTYDALARQSHEKQPLDALE